MKRRFMIPPLALVLCFMAGCPKQGEEETEEPVVDVEADKEAIKGWFDQYKNSIMAGNVDSLIALYAENIVILPPNGSVVKGRDVYRQWITGWFEEFSAEEHLEIQEIQVFGRNAFARGSHEYRNVHKESGLIKEGKGTFINIFERRSDGLWKCTHNMWTSVSPPPQKKE